MKISSPKKLNKTFQTFLTPKNLIKLFYTLNKTFYTPFGETGRLNNFCYLLAVQHLFFNLLPFPKHSQ